MVEKTNYLIAYAREMGYKIIFINHHEAERAFALDNPLSDFIPELNVDKNDTVINKFKVSSFYNTKLESELVGIRNLVVC
jgi:nicotinamidase-related amidase